MAQEGVFITHFVIDGRFGILVEDNLFLLMQVSEILFNLFAHPTAELQHSLRKPWGLGCSCSAAGVETKHGLIFLEVRFKYYKLEYSDC